MSKIFEVPTQTDNAQTDNNREIQIRASRLRRIQGHIEPFTETSSGQRADGNGRIGSHELFSLFTAEIIRQNVVFTR